MLAGWIALAGRSALQRGEQFGAEQRKISLDPAFAPDQHMIGRRKAVLGKEIAQQLAEAPLHPVADHRIADSLGHGDPEANLLRFIRAREQHKTGSRNAQAPVGSEKIRSPREDSEARGSPVAQAQSMAQTRSVAQADSFLRPRARRAARILRPPGVAERVRKPWRRARTRLLGWKVRFIAKNLKFE